MATKRSIHIGFLVALVAVPVLLLGLGGAYLWHGFDTASKDVTDPGRYRAILDDLGYPKPTKLRAPTLEQFPPAIPPASTNVRFFYRPHFLQGGTQLQLRVHLPSSDVAALLDRVRPLAKDAQSGGDMFAAVNARRGLPSATFRNADNGDFASHGLPDDFQVFVMDAKDSSPPSWNHGYSYGVAISEKASEVVYWLEDW